jgi:hypothetical protein
MRTWVSYICGDEDYCAWTFSLLGPLWPFLLPVELVIGFLLSVQYMVDAIT